MTHIIIDRRPNSNIKGSKNRQKFINRVKNLVKDGVKGIVRNSNIKDIVNNDSKKIKIPIKNLDEPSFRHDGSGVNDMVRPGNDRYITGDKIKRSGNGQGNGGKASGEGEGEDNFTFSLSKEEFLDIFFENCALPDLVKENFAILNEEIIQRSGFVSDGSPSAMNIMRSMKFAKSRRSGLKAAKSKKLKELELLREQWTSLLQNTSNKNSEEYKVLQLELDELISKIEHLKQTLKSIPYIDPVDLKFNNWERTQIPAVQAVVFCVMDVSGSMDERKKELAKTFFILMYLFLQRNYKHIDIVFVQYHTTAEIVDEQEFYYGKQSGGTVTSTGLQLVYDTIMQKYPINLWNIFVSHASDSDNFEYDNANVVDILTHKLLPLVQYYSYVHIEHEGYKSFSLNDSSENLLSIFQKIADNHGNLACASVTNEQEIYPVFLKLFERKV